MEVEDVRKAQPDAIALAPDGIVSRLEEDGDNKLTEALKSLCWRHNGIQAEVERYLNLLSTSCLKVSMLP